MQLKPRSLQHRRPQKWPNPRVDLEQGHGLGRTDPGWISLQGAWFQIAMPDHALRVPAKGKERKKDIDSVPVSEDCLMPTSR